MMTQQLEAGTLAAPLAAIDRRVLSQAWYSALHLARPQERAGELRERASSGTVPFQPSPLRESEGLPATRPSTLRLARTLRADAAAAAGQPNAGAPADRAIAPLSRRIERTFAPPSAPLRRATFSVGRGSARVHVILQTNGETATLVALCRPEMRGVVARALARARFSLAARGIVVAIGGQGAEACS